MTLANFARRIAGALALGLAAQAACAADAPAPPLPSRSVYQLEMSLQDQDGHSFHLADKRGRPMLVSMFYTSCEFVCPMLIDAARATEAKLDPAERERLPVLLVSFDPEHDSVAVLDSTARSRHLERGQWTLARANAADVRKLAALLGIQYRRLPDGDYNHTTALILLDKDGRVAGRTTRLGEADPAFLKAVKASLAPAAD